MPDGTDGTQDGQTSGDQEPTSVTMTQDELKTHNEKITSDALAGAGRTAADFKRQTDDLKAERTRLDGDIADHRQRTYATEDATASASEHSADAIATLRTNRTRTQAADDLKIRERKLEDDTRAFETRQAEAGVGALQRIAAEFKVDAGVLERFGDGTEARYRDLAKELAPKGAGDDPKSPDSLRTSGGGGPNEQEKMQAYIHGGAAPTDTLKRLGLTH